MSCKQGPSTPSPGKRQISRAHSPSYPIFKATQVSSILNHPHPPLQLQHTTSTMSPEPPIGHETNAAEIHSLIARDLAASNELAARIAELRQDIAEGKPQPSKKVASLERSNKDMTK